MCYAICPAGRLYKSKHLRKRGEVRYNGHSRREFNMARTVALVDQIDEHIANLTVRETLEFAYICQVRKGCCACCPAAAHLIWDMRRPTWTLLRKCISPKSHVVTLQNE